MASLKRFATLGAAGAAPPPASDPQFNLTTLLLHGDGTNGAQNNTFVDSSTNNFTITRNGNTTQGTFTPFSQTGWSNYFDGTDDYLIIADNAVLQAGTSNFTLEAWLYRGASGSAHTIYAKGGASTGIVFQVTSTNVLRFTHTTTNIDSTGTIAANSWTHVAVVREGTGTNQTKLYINGTQDGQGTVSTDFNQTEQVRIGTDRGATADFNGYISNLRFIKGTALYTTTFTPSTLPLTTTSQGATATEVELLTCQSNRFLDNSSNSFAITVSGTPSVQAFSPFAPTSAYSTSVVGGSGYFDGAGDNINAGSNTAFNIDSGSTDTFICEAWIYWNTVTANQSLIDNGGVSGTSFANWAITLDSSSRLAWNWGNSAAPGSNIGVINTTTVPVAGQWYHIALVKTNADWSMFINGARASTYNGLNTAAKTSSSPLQVATGIVSTTAGGTVFKGYISNVRIYKGATASAPYVATSTTITLPTAPQTSITNTSLLLNYTNAGIIDNTSKNDLETVGNAKISTAVTKFGTGSLAFDGTNSYLTYLNSAVAQIGGGNYTVEMWLYPNSISALQSLLSFGNASGRFRFFLDSSRLWVLNGSSSIASSAQSIVSTGQWYHVAVVRNGTAITIYRNGSSVATGTDSSNYTSGTPQIGAEGVATYLNGYIDDLRISKFARYTANFTPPTAAFLDQ